jgi:hypothetical protein
MSWMVPLSNGHRLCLRRIACQAGPTMTARVRSTAAAIACLFALPFLIGPVRAAGEADVFCMHRK